MHDLQKATGRPLLAVVGLMVVQLADNGTDGPPEGCVLGCPEKGATVGIDNKGNGESGAFASVQVPSMC